MLRSPTSETQLPATATIQTHRLNFSSFPIIGYSLTSDTVPQTQLWTATYELKPRLNRLDGVASVLVQGGQEPEFHITPDPAKLLAASVTITDILDAVRRTNLIDSPGLLQQDHQLYLALVDGQVKDPEQLGQIVIKTSRCAGDRTGPESQLPRGERICAYVKEQRPAGKWGSVFY